MSSLSGPGVFIPAKTPPAEKSLAEVTVPFGTDAIGRVMANVGLVRRFGDEVREY